MNEEKGSRHYYSYLNNAAAILQQYDGSIPFSYFIKNYFSQHKKFGSKDRKQISAICYAFFRLGKAFGDLPIAERIRTAIKYSPLAADNNWKKIIEESKLKATVPTDIFPWKNDLSSGIDSAAFENSFTHQPNLFLRIRPGQNTVVKNKLTKGGLIFEIKEQTVTLSNTANITSLLQLNKEAVVQDLSSQKIAGFIERVKDHFPAGQQLKVYDCCAASGGKSILAWDVLNTIDLSVSDIRRSIIINLKKRFKEAGITQYQSFLSDLTKTPRHTPTPTYDFIIADVPCTGSGTWARNPEQLYYFHPEKIKEYAAIQKKILHNIIPLLKPGGLLLYITCSVFKQENEEQTDALIKKGFTAIHQQTLKGYHNNADSMFAALLKG
ncbi:MAG: Fmu (Sun) domain protein [Niabella sp.]